MASQKNLPDPNQLYFQCAAERMREYQEKEDPFMTQNLSRLPSCCRRVFSVYARMSEDRYRYRHSMPRNKPMFVNFYRICWQRWTDMTVAEVSEFHTKVSDRDCPNLSHCTMSPSTRWGDILPKMSCDADEYQE